MNSILKGAGFGILPLFFFITLSSAEPYAYTLGFYFAGDNDLASQVDVDLEEIRKARYSEELNVVIFADRGAGSVQPGSFVYIKRDTFLIQIRDFGDLDSGDPQTLNFFVRFLRENYPSESYGLVLWGHGTSWMKSSDPFYKSIAFDAVSGNSIDVFNGELKWAIPDTIFNFIVMDACLMGGIEVLWELRGKARYVVASPALVPATGLNYMRFIDSFVSNIDNTILALNAIVNDYVEEYDSLGCSVLLSLYDLYKLQYIKTVLPGLVLESYNLAPHSLRKYRESSITYNLYSNEVQDTLAPFIDFCDFIGKWKGPHLFPFILNSKGNGVFQDAGGVSVYFPLSLNQVKEYFRKYRELSFERETNFMDIVLNTLRLEYFEGSNSTSYVVKNVGGYPVISFPSLVKTTKWYFVLEVYRDGVLKQSISTCACSFPLRITPGVYTLRLKVVSPFDGLFCFSQVVPESILVKEEDTPYYNSVLDSLGCAIDILGRNAGNNTKGILFKSGRKYLVY